jgi:hypothetical protein
MIRGCDPLDRMMEYLKFAFPDRAIETIGHDKVSQISFTKHATNIFALKGKFM